MSWLNKAIDRGVRKGVDDFLKSDKLERMIDEAIRSNPRFRFTKQMQARYLERCPDLTPKQAFDHAVTNLNAFLAGEKREFGHPDYDWSREGANTLVDEDMSYWETEPPQ